MIEIIDNYQPVNTFLALDEGDIFKTLNNELFMKIEEENFRNGSVNTLRFEDAALCHFENCDLVCMVNATLTIS